MTELVPPGALTPMQAGSVWTVEDNRFAWSALLGENVGSAATSPHASPARASDLSDLPPAYIMTGALDLFFEEDVEYARRLGCAGVSVELNVYAGAFHGFDLAEEAEVAQAARQRKSGSCPRLEEKLGVNVKGSVPVIPPRVVALRFCCGGPKRAEKPVDRRRLGKELTGL